MPDEPEAAGLLALILLEQARSRDAQHPGGHAHTPARAGPTPLGSALVEEGQDLVADASAKPPGPYQIQAAINAVHSVAPTAATPTGSRSSRSTTSSCGRPHPIVSLNRGIAVAEIDGPQVVLHLIDELPLEHCYLFHAIRANLLQRLGHTDQAEAAYRAAIARTDNAAEIAFMKDRVSAI